MSLREPAVCDAETLASWGSDAVFRDHAGWSGGSHLERLLAWWRTSIENPQQGLTRLIAVSDRDEIVGYVDLHQGRSGHELGFVIGPSMRWGAGLGTSTARAGVVLAFTSLDVDRLWAEAAATNTASTRILHRLGMSRTDDGGPTEFLGRLTYHQRFTITRSQWLGG